MSKRVLVVDDERDFRDQIRLTLESADFEVQGAANCHEAVRMVPDYRPDVLVADWMLRDHLHGLHVSEVLGTVNPGMHTVLMTGYASNDLIAEAAGHNVCAVLNKPFEPAKLAEAVRACDAPDAPEAHHPPIGVFQCAEDGSIVWANSHARELFASTIAGADAASITDMLGLEQAERLSHAPTQWLSVAPITRPGSGPVSGWHLLGKDLERGGSLLVLLDDARLPVLRDHPVVQSLLGTEDPIPVRWDLPGHVLLVDDEEYVRRFVAGQFQRAGCPCLTAENGEVALRLFARDEQIRYVLLDWYLPGDDAAALVREFKRIRPDVGIVGVSGEDRSEDFARVGIDRFLSKPVRVESLMAELRAQEAAKAPQPEAQDESDWERRLQELCTEFDAFMQRRPGARATRAMTVVQVLCDAWPRSLSVQEIVDKLWADPAQRMRRAAGSVRNALNTLTRNFEEFNGAVAAPLYGVRCVIWRSEESESRLCRYALRLQPVQQSVEASAGVREYLASLPRPVVESMHEFITGASRTLSPGADQACRDIGVDLADPVFRNIVVQLIDRSG